MKRTITKAGLFLLTILVAWSCGKDEESEPSNAAHSIELISGNNQIGTVNRTLLEEIILEVKDINGNPFKGAVVNFTVQEGNVSHSSVTSDSVGQVAVKWTLGSSAGEQVLTATSFKSQNDAELSGSPVTIKAIAEEPLPSSITYEGDNSGSFSISGVVKNQDDNIVSNIRVELIYESATQIRLEVESNDEGSYSFLGLPNLEQDFVPEFLSISATYDSEPLKYQPALFFPLLLSNEIPNSITTDIKILEVDNNTTLTGTIKYQDGTPVLAADLAAIEIGYENVYQSFLIQPMSSTSDSQTGSFYDESTGVYKFMNCLCGGDNNYTLHVNHRVLEVTGGYKNIAKTISITKGEENTVNVVLEPFE